MGMTIDEAVEDLVELARYYISHYGEDSTNNVPMDNENVLAIDTLIDVARKYQKIEQIYRKWNVDFGKQDYEILRQIGQVISEVLEDGNDDC